MWYKLAHHQRKTLQECLESNTSMEFLEWKIFLEDILWNEPTKEDHYLAGVRAAIMTFMSGFSSKPRAFTPEDCLLSFTRQLVSGNDKPAPQTQEATPTKDSKGSVEIGPDAIKDPKWAKINENAKGIWGMRLRGHEKAIVKNGQ